MIEYEGYVISVEEISGGFQGWVGRKDGKVVTSGYSTGSRIGTHVYELSEYAVQAARQAIDEGDVY